MFYRYDEANTLHIPEPYRRDLTPICMAECEESRASGISLHMTEWPAGGQADLHAHPDKAEWMYVVEGHGTALCDGETRPIDPGSLVVALPGVPHQLKNTGSGWLRVLCVYAGPQSARELERRALEPFRADAGAPENP